MTTEFFSAEWRYQLAVGSRNRTSDNVLCVNDQKRLRFSYFGRNIIQYNHAVGQPPKGITKIFARSGYIHPVWNPAGQVLTNDFPMHHKHHHGIWFPWTKTVFEGRDVDFWNMGSGKGKVEFLEFDSYGGGAIFGHFRARQRFIDLTAPSGPKAALDEVWEVRVYPFADYFLFDLKSTQTCASSSPLKLGEHHYGGMGFRGSGEWEGPGDACKFLSSDGKTRANGHKSRARWFDVTSDLEEKPTGITFMCHPENFRFPQPMRVHPKEPFFNFAPCQLGHFTIESGRPYVSRYRYYVHNGDVDPETSERMWHDYANPPEIRVIDNR